MTFIDLPGILDTHGINQQIINAYLTSLLFRSGHILKFVIVIEVASLKDSRGYMFTEIISRLETLLGKTFTEIASSCLMVITKTNP